jgi:hypothetical protein
MPTTKAKRVTKAAPKRIMKLTFPPYQKRGWQCQSVAWSYLARRYLTYFSASMPCATDWAKEHNYKAGTLLKKGTYQERLWKLLLSIKTFREEIAKREIEAVDVKTWETYGRLVIALSKENHPGWCSEGPDGVNEAKKLLDKKDHSKSIRIALRDMIVTPFAMPMTADELRITLRDKEGNVLIDDVSISTIEIGG